MSQPDVCVISLALQAFVVVLTIVGCSGCTLGVGPHTAASAPGGTDLVRWVATSNQAGVADGYVRTRAESHDQFRSPVGVHGGVRKGWWNGGLDGLSTTGGEMTEMHFDLTVPIFVAPVSVGLSYLRGTHQIQWSEGVSLEHEGGGFAGRVSFAPLPMLSLDALVGRSGGSLTLKNRTGSLSTSDDVGVTRLSIGLTFQIVRMFGIRIDLNRISGDAMLYGRELGWSAWGPSFEGVIALW